MHALLLRTRLLRQPHAATATAMAALRVAVRAFKTDTTAATLVGEVGLDGFHTEVPTISPKTLELADKLLSGNRRALSRAITLAESSNPEHELQSRLLMQYVAPRTQKDRNSFRVGITGPPGAGKSSFIEQVGQVIIDSGRKLAVLAVDPSSRVSGGSILGDVTRMPHLSSSPDAFLRPSPSRGHLGGVTRDTNNAIMLCEAAGFDHVLVETVGAGQSEYSVADMADMFVLVLPPGGGDELQGIKKGVVEEVDMVLINKADGSLKDAATRSRFEYMSALKFLRQKHPFWNPPVLTMSKYDDESMLAVWKAMQEFHAKMDLSGLLQKRRVQHMREHMHAHMRHTMRRLLRNSTAVHEQRQRLLHVMENGDMAPEVAGDHLLRVFFRDYMKSHCTRCGE